MTDISKNMKLAIDGGSPVCSEAMPSRHLIGLEEKQAAMKIFDDAISSGQAFGYNGPYTKAYEKAFCEFMGGGTAVAVNSGTNALFVSLHSLGLDAMSEVIVPAITDPGGVMPVCFAGCVPVMADTDRRSYNICAEQIERVITERTRAIIVAHIAGEPADIDPIMALAKAHNLYVIEDCAQAHGARYKGQPVGTIGDIAAFSTMFSKHHCTGGQGGLVYCKDESMQTRIASYADRGKAPEGNVVAALNCNLNELSAAIGCEQIKKLPGIIASRQKFGELIKQGLEKCKAVSMGFQVPDTEPVYWFLRFNIDADSIKVTKEEFCKALTEEGIPEVIPSYRNIPCEMDWFKNKVVFGKSGFPWNCSDYKGQKQPQFKFDNVTKAIETSFIIVINESYGQTEADNLLCAIEKVENAYLK